MIIPFNDPRDHTTYDIIDGRALIALKDAPVLPLMGPNYFDVQRPLSDPYYQMVHYSQIMVDGQAVDPELQAFLTAEDVTVYSDWPAVGGVAVALPPGQTVLDAVANWPAQYPDLIESVDPDTVLKSCSMPLSKPNDDAFDWLAEAWHLMPDSLLTAPNWWPPGQVPVKQYSADLASVWGPGLESYGEGVIVAVFDSGVDFANPDLIANSYPYGFNTGDNKDSTEFRSRAQGGGAPWDYLMERSQVNASGLGHGTAVAGVISAEAENDPIQAPPRDVRDTIGVAPGATYLPFAIKGKGTNGGAVNTWSMSAFLNALSALGGAKGLYEDEMIEGPDPGT